MTLLEKQWLFMELFPRLIDYAYRLGLKLALGEGYVGLSIDKPTEDTPHIRRGNHFNKLAVDLDLFRLNSKTGQYEYAADTEAHRLLGEFWERQHPLCRWGGRWGDGNHYSILHDGVA